MSLYNQSWTEPISIEIIGGRYVWNNTMSLYSLSWTEPLSMELISVGYVWYSTMFLDTLSRTEPLSIELIGFGYVWYNTMYMYCLSRPEPLGIYIILGMDDIMKYLRMMHKYVPSCYWIITENRELFGWIKTTSAKHKDRWLYYCFSCHIHYKNKITNTWLDVTKKKKHNMKQRRNQLRENVMILFSAFKDVVHINID